jgi:hypothetical protein
MISDYYVNVQISSADMNRNSGATTPYTGPATLDLHTGDCSLARGSYSAQPGNPHIAMAQVIQAPAMPPAPPQAAPQFGVDGQPQAGAPQQAVPVPVATIATAAAFVPGAGGAIPVARPVTD